MPSECLSELESVFERKDDCAPMAASVRLDELERRNLAVYLVVLWWNQIKGTSSPYAVDPSLDTCYTYGRTLGQRWRERRNLVWVWAPSPDRRASSSSSSSSSASHWPPTP